MIEIFLKLILVALGVLLAAYLMPGISVASFYTALIVAVLLGFLSLIVKPILIILTLPINILTLGLFTFIINGFLFWFIAFFISGFTVANFFSAVLGALVVSIVSFIGEKLVISSD